MGLIPLTCLDMTSIEKLFVEYIRIVNRNHTIELAQQIEVAHKKGN